jgi:hypothetical protein
VRQLLKNKDSLTKICGKLQARAQCSNHIAEIKFLIKIQKLKKGPLRGTPHNLSKVSLEVKELKITDRYTTASKQP